MMLFTYFASIKLTLETGLWNDSLFHFLRITNLFKANCFAKQYQVLAKIRLPRATFQIISNQSYIGDIEDYTLMIEHSIRGKATTIAVCNGLMDGKLMASDGKAVVKSWTNVTRMDENPYADGDIIKCPTC